MKNLKSYGIDYLDLREEIKKDNLNHYDMFFKTDHHWLPSSGLWAAKKIAHVLNNQYSFNIDEKNYDLKNYNIETFKNCFLGSQGKRVGKLYGGCDDLDVITPNYYTDFEVSYPNYNMNYLGEFKDTLIDYSKINADDLYNSDAYNTYLRGNYDITLIKNNCSPNNKKVLLLKDSFSCTMVPYLSLSCKELDMIDLRYFKDSIRDYIKENKFDIIIVMYSSQQDEFFNFN